MDFPVYVPSPATVKSYHLGQTPATLVVSASGVLLKMWAGAYTGLTKKAIEEYFNVTLPTS